MASEWDLAAFWPEFSQEVQSNLERLETGLLRLEEGELEAVHELFRAAHTIKGAARVMGLQEMADLAAQLEEHFVALRDGEVEDPTHIVQAAWSLVDAIRTALEYARPDREAAPKAGDKQVKPGPEEQTAQEAPRPKPKVSKLVPVREDLLETLTTLNKALHHQYLRLESLVASLDPRGQGFSPRAAAPHEMAGREVWTIESWRLLLQEHLAGLRTTLGQLEETTLRLRLVPFGRLHTAILRLVREAAHGLGKEVTCRVEGEHTLVDRKLLQPLQDVLTHLLRNAVDHGIEPPDERERAGKPRQGTIIVRAQATDVHVIVEVIDDGRGMDPETIRRAAQERGLIQAKEARRMTSGQILRLIFEPGFSTRTEVGDYSGRGVGLDVVASTVRQFGGRVDVESTPGQGTRFVLRWPLDMALSKIVVVRVGLWTVGLPHQHVMAVLSAREVDFITSGEETYISWQGQLLPVFPFDRWFPISPNGAHVVVARARSRQVALAGGNVLQVQDLVVQPLPLLLSGVRGAQGVALLGDGTALFVLDVDQLFTLPGVRVRTRQGERTPGAKRHPGPILVVDDMFLSRDLLRSTLVAAGYEVLTAASAEEALTLLAQTPNVAAVITDVHMPGMDGLALTRYLRQHPRWRDVPIIILSADADPKVVQAGLEAGANAYLTKEDFEQGTLLETVERVL